MSTPQRRELTMKLITQYNAQLPYSLLQKVYSPEHNLTDVEYTTTLILMAAFSVVQSQTVSEWWEANMVQDIKWYDWGLLTANNAVDWSDIPVYNDNYWLCHVISPSVKFSKVFKLREFIIR